MNKNKPKSILKSNQTLLNLWSAELINRSSYMTGKFALPFFAKNLGASTTLIGTISSISTLTGIFLKPIIGGIGDKFNKKQLLLLANLIFALTPLFYIFIDQTYQLVIIRLFHGLSTAIYGPITLAIISTVYTNQRATYLGWFGTARTIGYLVGPILGGLLMLYYDSKNLFFLTGIISFISFIPIILDKNSSSTVISSKKSTSREIILFIKKLFTITKLKQVWVVSLIEWSFYAVFYSMKVFVPIYLVNSGYNTLIAGSFLTTVEIIHIILRPLGGISGDKFGYYKNIIFGLLLLSVSMFFVSFTINSSTIFIPAILIGISEASVLPSALALVSEYSKNDNIGTVMGIVGSIRNFGKVAGPIFIGILLEKLSYQSVFQIIGITNILVVLFIIMIFIFSSMIKKKN
mgnify:CR=1 FL=1|tara:strand:- start:3896 stop:5110 length:1215 start_codon:yes stop_codon:yes gene_type:complete